MNYYEQLVANEKTFTDELKRDYPSLFYKNDAGELVAPDCGISCPNGWKPLVRELCRLIDAHNNDYKLLKTKNPYKRFKMWIYNKGVVPIHNFFWKLFDPKSINKKKCWLVPELNELEKKHPTRIKCRNFIQKIGWKLRPTDFYEQIPNTVTKIAQIKSKFRCLCFYTDNSDEFVSGAIAFASQLSMGICEKTGEKGFYCKKNGWIATLSIDKAKELGYSVPDETTRS